MAKKKKFHWTQSLIDAGINDGVLRVEKDHFIVLEGDFKGYIVELDNAFKSGAPTKYNHGLPMELELHLAQGNSFDSFAAVVKYKTKDGDEKTGVTKQTLYNWISEYALFAESKSIGEAKGLLFFEQMGTAMATGTLRRRKLDFKEGDVGSKGFERTGGNQKVWNVIMRNRYGYRSNPNLLGSKIGAKNNEELPSEKSLAEIEKELAELRKVNEQDSKQLRAK